jgi:hypothetical protein
MRTLALMAATVAVLRGVPAAALAGEVVTVDPSGVVAWAEMQGSGDATAPSAPRGPVVITGFPALGDDNTGIPPDTNGAAGPNHLMTMLNSQVRIQDKTGGVVSTATLDAFWTTGTGLSGSPFDPRLVYDAGSGRWIATVDANSRSATSAVWFAISDDDDPTGVWSFYAFDADGTNTNWADFPGFGVNDRWIAIANNMFTVAGDAFSGAKLWVIDKATALDGGSISTTIFPTNFDFEGTFGTSGFALQPAVTFGTEPTLFLVDNSGFTAGNALMRLSRITGTGPAPVWSVVPGSAFAGTGLFPVDNDFDQLQIGASQSGIASTCSGGPNDGDPCDTVDDCLGPPPPNGACLEEAEGQPPAGLLDRRELRLLGRGHGHRFTAGVMLRTMAITAF